MRGPFLLRDLKDLYDFEPGVLDGLVARYRALAASGLAVNLYRRTATAKDARRFLGFEDMILRFATHPDLDIFTNNEAERTIRPVKVQQRSSGGAWRTLEGLADSATVQSYLSTAAKTSPRRRCHIKPLTLAE